jgi:RNA polymerase-binding transcription factor DksA
VNPGQVPARLAAERALEQALRHHRHENDGDDPGRLEPGSLALHLYLDKLEGLAEDLRGRLAALERTAQRLAAGIYGISPEGGQPITDERLEAFPIAERSVEEQRPLVEGGG